MRGTTRSCIHSCLEPLSEANVRLSMKEFSRKGNVHDIGNPNQRLHSLEISAREIAPAVVENVSGYSFHSHATYCLRPVHSSRTKDSRALKRDDMARQPLTRLGADRLHAFAQSACGTRHALHRLVSRRFLLSSVKKHVQSSDRTGGTASFTFQLRPEHLPTRGEERKETLNEYSQHVS
jgi:hypothetical protein